jgi:hypothetical protein
MNIQFNHQYSCCIHHDNSLIYFIRNGCYTNHFNHRINHDQCIIMDYDSIEVSKANI